MRETRVLNSYRRTVLIAFVALSAQFWGMGHPLAQTQPISIFIVRHGEVDTSQSPLLLNAVGRQRAEVLAQTLQTVRFTHVFASHTTRTRQMIERIASVHGLPITQLPVPGSSFDGQLVTDDTSRRAPIEPVASALLKLPPGSVALAALNSENIFAILNRLGVPVAQAGQSCAPGSMCVPCADNTCFKGFDRLWVLVREPGRAEPLSFIEVRYGAGWRTTADADAPSGRRP
jgi:hypothetical protein